MQKDYFKRVSQTTPTRFWVNNVTREEAQLGIAAGAVGCTQNPSFPWKMLSDPEEGPYATALLDAIMKEESDDEKALVRLQRDLVGEIARAFLPMFEATQGKQGWVSIQGDPYREDVESIISFARFHREAGKNIIIKVPATKDGITAMRTLLREGVPLLATEVMGIDQTMDLVELYREASAGMQQPPVMYMAHIAGIFDEHMQACNEAENLQIQPDALWQAGIAVAKKIRQALDNEGSGIQMLSGGARGLHHFTEMVGARSDVTINWKGTADRLLENNPPAVQRFLAPVAYNVLDELLQKSDVFRKAYVPGSLSQEEYEHFGPVVRFRTSFEKAWTKSLQLIAERRKA